jgi:hypothetical protein
LSSSRTNHPVLRHHLPTAVWRHQPCTLILPEQDCATIPWGCDVLTATPPMRNALKHPKRTRTPCKGRSTGSLTCARPPFQLCCCTLLKDHDCHQHHHHHHTSAHDGGDNATTMMATHPTIAEAPATSTGPALDRCFFRYIPPTTRLPLRLRAGAKA